MQVDRHAHSRRTDTSEHHVLHLERLPLFVGPAVLCTLVLRDWCFHSACAHSVDTNAFYLKRSEIRCYCVHCRSRIHHMSNVSNAKSKTGCRSNVPFPLTNRTRKKHCIWADGSEVFYGSTYRIWQSRRRSYVRAARWHLMTSLLISSSACQHTVTCRR